MRNAAVRLMSLFALASVLWGAEQPQSKRFGRELLGASEPDKYVVVTRDDVKETAIRSERHTVGCLLYRDPDRYYVEITVRNRSASDLIIQDDLIAMEQDGRKLNRVDTIRASEDVEANTRKPFVPAPSRVDDKTKRALYDRAHVDEQAKRHIAWQESESTFASMLSALAIETAPRMINAGREQAYIAVFDRTKKPGPVIVLVRVAGDELKFAFNP